MNIKHFYTIPLHERPITRIIPKKEAAEAFGVPIFETKEAWLQFSEQHELYFEVSNGKTYLPIDTSTGPVAFIKRAKGYKPLFKGKTPCHFLYARDFDKQYYNKKRYILSVALVPESDVIEQLKPSLIATLVGNSFEFYYDFTEKELNIVYAHYLTSPKRSISLHEVDSVYKSPQQFYTLFNYYLNLDITEPLLEELSKEVVILARHCVAVGEPLKKFRLNEQHPYFQTHLKGLRFLQEKPKGSILLPISYAFLNLLNTHLALFNQDIKQFILNSEGVLLNKHQIYFSYNKKKLKELLGITILQKPSSSHAFISYDILKRIQMDTTIQHLSFGNTKHTDLLTIQPTQFFVNVQHFLEKLPTIELNKLTKPYVLVNLKKIKIFCRHMHYTKHSFLLGKHHQYFVFLLSKELEEDELKLTMEFN